jgi:DnaJ-like protein
MWCGEWIPNVSHLNMPPIAPAPVNYYSILGVAPTADIASVNAAFRRLARRYHPDRNPAPDATVQFQNINEARRILSDPVRRARYDCTCHIQPGGDGRATWIPSCSRHGRKRSRRRPLRMVMLILASGLLIPTFWAALLLSLMRLHSNSSMLDSTPELSSRPLNCGVSLKTFPVIDDGSYGDAVMTWDTAGTKP